MVGKKEKNIYCAAPSYVKICAAHEMAFLIPL
jgi:hypothetical protein